MLRDLVERETGSAKELGCETLYSEELNPGQTYGGVGVSNPFLG